MKVLLLDTNVASYPIYLSLIESKFEVFVCGNNQDDCLARISKNFLKIDYSNISKVIDLCNKFQINFVLPGCNDVSYKSASLCNERLKNKINITENVKSDIINNKYLFKKFALKNGINVPQNIDPGIDKIPINKKIIIKPSDSYSGNGITVIDNTNFEKLEHAINLARSFSKDSKISIEEFISGDLFSHSAFIENGKIINDFIVKEYCLSNPYKVDTSWVVHENKYFDKQLIRSEILKIVKTLNLSNGLIHTQFISAKNNLYIIEVTRRCPGDLYSLLIEYSTGFNYSKNYTNYFFNKKFINYKSLSNKLVLRHTITNNSEFKFLSLKLKNQIDYKVIDFIPSVFSGTKVNPIPNGKTGIIFFELKSFEELNELKNIIKKGELQYKINI